MRKSQLSIKIEKKNIILGMMLISLGIVLPVFFNVYNFGIYDMLSESLSQNDKGLLLGAAIRLVVLNSLRGLPHYLGTFIIAESTDLSYKGKRVPHFKGLFALLIIPLVYTIINTAHNIKYDLGVPAFIVIFAIMYLEKMDFTEISLQKKTFIIILLLLGVQWLDVIPKLSIFGFGRGETSQDVKAIAELIVASRILSIFALMLSIIFTLNSILVAKLINDEHKILVTTEKNKLVEKELHNAKIKALQARNYVELKNLVHDLKTPLTSSQALVSVLMMMDDNSSPKKGLYLRKIEESIDRLDEMISEILDEGKKMFVTTEELVDYTLSHISHLPLSSIITYENNAKECYVEVNKIRFTRAIINALDNSYKAIKPKDGSIHFLISADDKYVYIEIIDNGIGIEDGYIEEVASRGFSIRESTGLGLAFINDVVNNHDGKMELKSKPGVGTSIKIRLNKVRIYE